MSETLALLMFGVAIAAVMAGYQVAFTLAGVGTLFALLGQTLGIFDLIFLTGLPSRYFGIMANEILVAVPLFVFMGVCLERSRIAEDLLETMAGLFGRMPGGLGISVTLVGAMLAASTGIVGATVVTMGLLSLPSMLRAHYDPGLASGLICASGTLGQVIPPSTILIFVATLLQTANQRAQMALDNPAPDPVSVGQLFAGTFLPGLLLVALYLAWVGAQAVWRPQHCPPASTATSGRPSFSRVGVTLAPPLALIVGVLGSILVGLATPTESASVGAVGALALTAARRLLTTELLRSVLTSSLTITAMIFTIFLGASLFSLVFRGLDGDIFVADLLSRVPGGPSAALLTVLAVMFVLGFFLDTLELIFIVIPITAPALIQLGIDPVWLGVLIGMVLQTSFLTPPFGFALFYLRGVAPPTVTTGVVYRGVLPFVVLQLAALLMVWLLPELATRLPDTLFGPEVPAESASQEVHDHGAENTSDEGDLNYLFE
ncbi:TRAP transporter large permease [Arhodomonas sp. SL1]|uniref:TRAP transporter large permease n=1 Tax=Arhodomonas sp. SL1 TaxID=3425691 RepID=UPI003F8827B2